MDKVTKYTRLALLTLALVLSTVACDESEDTQQPIYNTRPCTTNRPCKADEDVNRSFGTAND